MKNTQESPFLLTSLLRSTTEQQLRQPSKLYSGPTNLQLRRLRAII